jgi:hypothetical protein
MPALSAILKVLTGTTKKCKVLALSRQNLKLLLLE